MPGCRPQFKDRTMHKTYVALVEGTRQPAEAMIDAPIGRDTNNRRRMAIDGVAPREAQTSYRTLANYDGMTLVEATLHTGRTHQIRVHFASLGHPLAGDMLYGKASKLVPRQFLHAKRLGFKHPVDGRELSFEAPMPEDLASALRAYQGRSEQRRRTSSTRQVRTCRSDSRASMRLTVRRTPVDAMTRLSRLSRPGQTRRKWLPLLRTISVADLL